MPIATLTVYNSTKTMISGIWISFTKYRIALACSMIYLLHMGLVRIVGLLVVASIDRYNVSREQATFPYVLRGIMDHLSGPFVGYLGCKFGLGQVTILGCCLTSIAVGACFFAESILAVTICWGIFFGLSVGMSGQLLPSFISLHFQKNLAKANGIALAGSALGAFIYSPFYEYLLKTYGTSGSFLILSAFSLNTLAVAMFLAYSQRRLEASQRRSSRIKNPSLHAKACPSTVSSGVGDVTSKALFSCEIRLEKDANHLTNSPEMKIDDIVDGNSNVKDPNMYSLDETNYYVADDGKRDFQEESSDNSAKISSAPAGLSDAIKNMSCTTEGEKIHVKEKPQDCQCKSLANIKSNDKTCGEIECNHNKNNSKQPPVKAASQDPVSQHATPQPSLIWKSLTLFLDPLFIIIAFTQSCFIVITHFLLATMIDYAFDNGVPMNLSVYLLMSCSVWDLIGRLILGSVTDGGYMSAANFSALCYFVTGISFAGMAISTEFFGMLMSLSFSSFVLGGQLLISPVIVLNYFVGEKRVMAMTSRYILVAPLSFTISPLIGFFREGLGSYKWLFYSISLFCLFASILLLFLPSIAHARKKRRKEEIVG